MVREVTLAVQSVLCRAHLLSPGQGCLPAAERCASSAGAPPGPSEQCWDLRLVLSLLQPPGWQQTLQPWSWPHTAPLSEDQKQDRSLNKELENFIEGLHWHEEGLPFLKTVFPRAHAVIRLLCPHKHRICWSVKSQHAAQTH